MCVSVWAGDESARAASDGARWTDGHSACVVNVQKEVRLSWVVTVTHWVAPCMLITLLVHPLKYDVAERFRLRDLLSRVGYRVNRNGHCTLAIFFYRSSQVAARANWQPESDFTEARNVAPRGRGVGRRRRVFR